MIKSTFGVGRNTLDARECVKEAVKDFNAPKVIFFFSGEARFPEYSALIKEMFPDAICIGCSAYMTWDGSGAEKGVLKTLAIEDGISAAAGVIEKADNFALSYADAVENCVDSVRETENTVCIEFTVPYKRADEYALMVLNSILLRNDIPIIGGTAAYGPDSEDAYVSLDGKVYAAGCVFVLIHSFSGAIRLYRENIYEPLTGHKLTVTKANCMTRTIMAYDEKPAAEVYAKELGIPLSGIEKRFFHNPMGRNVDGETFVTAIRKQGSGGSLKHYARVYENTEMVVMKEGDYKKITSDTIEQICGETENPSLVMMFQCVARTVLFEENGYINEYSEMLSRAFKNYIGFSCLGEQMGTKHFNHTMMAVVFE